MVAAFVLIGGGIGICAFVMAVFQLGDPWFGHAGYFTGALIGGYTVGRVSPGITVVEPAVAGFLFTGLLFALFGLSPGSTFIWSEGTGTDLLHRALSLGALSLLGALVGAVAGERTGGDEARVSGAFIHTLRQMWLSFLAYSGLLLAGAVLFMIVLQTTDEKLVDSPGLFWLGFCGAAVGAGVLAQAVSGRRAILASASGPLWFYLSLGTFAAAHTGGHSIFILFLGIGGGVLSLLSLLGSAVTHAHLSRRQPKAAAPPLAKARLAHRD